LGKLLQQYHIFKFSSQRLKKSNYNINISISQARLNGEIVALGDSQMLRSLRQIKSQMDDYQNQIKGQLEDHQEIIHNLILERKKIKNSYSSYGNIEKLAEIEEKIDQELFVPEIISVYFENNSHYRNIGENGFIINGIKYVRLLCSAGNARRNIAMFVSDEYEKPLKKILNNGRNENLELIPNKFSAYFSLASSSSHAVSTPYFCVVPDCITTRLEKVDFILEHPSGDDNIQEVEKEIEFNLFDGQGLISPATAERWAGELCLDYIPSTFVIRSSFLKGMLVTFDFHEFSDEYGKHIIKDVWGNTYNIRDADIIITKSMFKLWDGWKSLDDYIKSCKENNIGWSVSKWSPKQEKTHANLNYQFLQVLDLNRSQIHSLCKPTVDYLNGIINSKYYYTLLYLMGEISNREYDPLIYSKLQDNVCKAVLLNNNLLNDPYIKSYLIRSLNKKIKESYLGNLIVDGFYTTMINDPYAFCEYIFGLPIKGLLEKDEQYSQYWSEKGCRKLAAMRAPLTWRSEVNILNLKSNPEIEKWYRYIYSGVVYNIHGMDHMLHGGSDVDGDLVCVTNQKEIISGATGGNPIYYETKKAEKKRIVEDELYLYDIKGFNTKVGFLTNISTTMYAMLPEFKKDTLEYEMLINRLKQCRKEQGGIIDSQKGLEIRPIPKHWTNWSKTTEDMAKVEKENAAFNNSILIDKRPYFFRYLYSQYAKKHNNYNSAYENYCITTFGKSLREVLNSSESEEEIKTKDKYHKYSPLLDSDCIMNRICHFMEENVQEIKAESKSLKPADNTFISILKNSNIPIDKNKLKLVYNIYKKYRSEKRNFNKIKNSSGEEMYRTLEQYDKYIRQECFKISSSIQELAQLAVIICYELHPSDSKSFAWSVFGDGIIENIELNRQEVSLVPFLDEKGNIRYLGKNYSLYPVEIVIQELEEDNDGGNIYDDL